jgi:hypothetical protein
MMYSALDAMQAPLDDTYVTYCGRTDGSGLMYATIDPAQRVAMSHRAFGIQQQSPTSMVTISCPRPRL